MDKYVGARVSGTALMLTVLGGAAPGVQRNPVLRAPPHSRAPYRPTSCILCCKLTFPGPGLLGGLTASFLAINP